MSPPTNTSTIINAKTVNNTLNVIASSAFDEPPPPPIDYSSLTNMTLSPGEWAVFSCVSGMLCLVLAVVCWRLYTLYQQKRRALAAERKLQDGDFDAEEIFDEQARARSGGWEVEKEGMVRQRSIVFGVRGSYSYRLSHAIEVIRGK